MNRRFFIPFLCALLPPLAPAFAKSGGWNTYGNVMQVALQMRAQKGVMRGTGRFRPRWQSGRHRESQGSCDP
ncbi:MAG: hypothetical protein EPN97_10470 [Alphaproteobacteria bacterium]|nr:MAG: hypothetical protein EPN97_10470 [Alphaproteobacteria bacterium]